MLLLHGQPGTHAVWLPAIPALRRTGARVIAVDRPGYDGHPEEATGFTGNAVAVLRLLDHLGLDRAVLVGHSWGGGVALRTAQLAPERVTGLVLAASVGTRSALLRADRLLAAGPARRLVGLGMSLLPAAVASLAMTASGSHLPRDERRWVLAGLAEWRRRGAWQAFAIEQLELVSETPRLEQDLALLDPALRCLVVHGRHDGYVPLAAARDLASRIAGAKLVEVEAGHLLPLEVPDVLADAVACALTPT